MVKNPNWLEANQLAIYKHDRGFELKTAKNKSSKRSGRDFNTLYSGHCRDFEFAFSLARVHNSGPQFISVKHL